jgi:septum site-determining protein MinC
LSTNLELRLNPQSPAPAATAPAAIVSIRYGQVGLVQIRVRTTDPGIIVDELTGRVAGAPHFFRRTAACLDLGALERLPDVAEVRTAIDAIRRAGMLIVGLSGSAAELETLSNALGLPVIGTFRAAGTPAMPPPAAAIPTVSPIDAQPVPNDGRAGESGTGDTLAGEAPGANDASDARPVTAEAAPALIHTQPVRSGQRLYGRDRDLIIMAGVGPGAEVMADGCLHVYGALRGRAMAGAHGQLTARIFCQEFYAELVSIAGVFRVFETLPAELAGKPVQAWLEGESLHFARIGG